MNKTPGEETFHDVLRRACQQAEPEQLEEVRLIATRRSFGLEQPAERKRRRDFHVELIVITGGRGRKD